MGTQRSRRLKQEWLLGYIESFFKSKPKEAISMKKLLALYALETFSTTRTGREILQSLQDLGRVKINGDNITK